MLVRADREAARLAAELAAQGEPDCFISAAEVEMEIPSKTKPFVEVEIIRINAETTVEIETRSGVAMGGMGNP